MAADFRGNLADQLRHLTLACAGAVASVRGQPQTPDALTFCLLLTCMRCSESAACKGRADKIRAEPRTNSTPAELTLCNVNSLLLLDRTRIIWQ